MALSLQLFPVHLLVATPAHTCCLQPLLQFRMVVQICMPRSDGDKRLSCIARPRTVLFAMHKDEGGSACSWSGWKNPSATECGQAARFRKEAVQQREGLAT